MPKHITRHKMLTILISLSLTLGSSAGTFSAAAAPAAGDAAATAADSAAVAGPAAPQPSLSAAQAPAAPPAQQPAAKGKTKTQKGQKQKQAKPSGPIVVEADDLRFSDETGDVLALGHVHITQDGTELLADRMDGNTKRTSLWVDGAATYLEPAQQATLTGNGIFYNYQQKTGTMETAHGKVGRDFVSGQAIDMQPEEYIIHNGTTTTCPARIPDYHVSADKIEIYPGDKMILYNAKFWIKNMMIFRLGKYEKKLDQTQNTAPIFPRIGYQSNGGFFVREYLAYPVSDKLTIGADLTYYTEQGFKPAFDATYSQKAYTLKLLDGNFIDSDDHWITKEPELNFSLKPRRIGGSPFSYTINAAYGKWSDSAKSSWHQDYNFYVSRDPLKLSDSLKLHLGAGYERIQESYDGSVVNSFRFDATAYKTFSPKFTVWTGYHYTKSNNSLFAYERADLGRELDTGFSYKIDRLNTISFNQSYDLTNNRVYDQDYTWTRNLHCWEANITYRARRNEVQFKVNTINW